MAIEEIAQNALKALLYEVVTNPKPGLVDPADVGSHPDMNVYMFIDSSLSLEKYFVQAAEIGFNFTGQDLRQMFELLRQAGIKAEKAMLAATNNVNTHKGAVFSLGLFVCACAYCQKHGGNEFEVIQMMTKGLVKHDLGEKSETAGERQFLQYGKGGVRAEAEAGYPLVRSVALPFLAQTSGDLNTRLLDTLMEIVSEIEDKIKNSESVILFEYQGLTVAEVSELRKKLREAQGEVRVYKNTLLKRALDDLNIDLNGFLEGPNAIMFGAELLEPIKVIANFAKEHDKMQIRVGIINGDVAELSVINEYAAIPSYEGLLTMLAAGMMEHVRNLAIGLNMYAEKLEN